ncbi:MAG: TetR/AcrR family transcriptional regulator [Hyphomicrobiaceae bacterium]
MARRSDHTPEALKGLILDAAEAIVADDGLSALTARGIATRIGYSPGTIYHLFANLDEVVLHVEARVLERLEQRLTALPPAAEPEAGLRSLAETYLAFTLANRRLWSMLFEHTLPKEVETPDWYAQRLGRLLAILEQALQPFFRAEQAGERIRAARVLWASVHGIVSLSVADKLTNVTTDTAALLIDDLITTYVAGIKHRHAI